MSYWDKKPPRRQMQAFIAPVREALKQMRSGEVDSIDGFPVFKDWQGDWARIDWAMNGFVSMVSRAEPDLDMSLFDNLAAKLESGMLMTVQEIDQALSILKTVEKALTKVTRARLKECVLDEQIDIELSQMGLKGEYGTENAPAV